MKKEKISEIIGQIRSEYVNEAAVYAGKTKSIRQSGWIKWTVAACIVLIMVISVIQRGWGTQTVILDNGEKISFAKSASGIGSPDIAFYIETRTLTENEIEDLFQELPVEAYALFNAENGEILGMEGEISGMKLIVSVPGVLLNDVVVEGVESISVVGDVPVRAGYFIHGKTIIYYAHFTIGESTVYLEHAGEKKHSDIYREEAAVMIQKLIALREINLRAIRR